MFTHDVKQEKMICLDVYLFRIFLEHDQTRGTCVSYDFSNSWANWRVAFLFPIVGLIIQMVIELFATKLIDFELKDWNSLSTNVFARSL